MRVIVLILGGLVVVIAVLIGLSLAGTPQPSCADGSVVASAGGANSFNSKWNGFSAALARGEPATVTFTEEELTSRGASYLVETNTVARDLQVHLCPGPGVGQAALRMEVLGRSLDVVATGHVQLQPGGSRVVVDSVQVGMVPEQIGALAVNTIVERANLQLPAEVREVTTTSTAATLKGQR